MKEWPYKARERVTSCRHLYRHQRKNYFLATCEFWIGDSPGLSQHDSERTVFRTRTNTLHNVVPYFKCGNHTESCPLWRECNREKKEAVPKKYHKYVTQSRDTWPEFQGSGNRLRLTRFKTQEGLSHFWRTLQVKEKISLSLFLIFTF
jgi:hypothetical protein